MSAAERQIEVKAEKRSLDTVMKFLEDNLEADGCPPNVRGRIALAAEEIFVNIASYAYGGDAMADGTDTAIIRYAPDGGGRGATVTFIDHGAPYNPLAKTDPDITAAAKDRPSGGLGIFMVKQLMDAVSYSFENGQNVLVVRHGWDS